VTKKQRRVAKFDPEIVRQAIAHNCPTRIVLNHLDYVDCECANTGRLTSKAQIFVESIIKEIRSNIDYIGYDRIGVSDFMANK
jgi:adenylosuccinate synthase